MERRSCSIDPNAFSLFILPIATSTSVGYFIPFGPKPSDVNQMPRNDPNDRLAAALLVILIATSVIIVAFAWTDPNAFESPQTHPQFESMQVGGVAADRDETYWWVGWIIGSLMLTFASGLILLGVNQVADNGGLRAISILITLVLLTVFACGSLAYRDFGQPGQSLIKSIAPSATKILLFGVWVVPMFFTIVYVLGFDRWFMPETPNSELEQ